MDGIIKALGKFLTRDIMYVIGGLSFLLSFSYAFGFILNYLDILLENNIAFLVFLGISYVTGYINQEILSFTPILTTYISQNLILFSLIIFWGGLSGLKLPPTILKIFII